MKLVHRHSIYIVLVTVVLFVTVSCREDVKKESLGSYSGQTYEELFEAFWGGMNTNYLFWEIDDVDWDNMYTTFKPRFAALDNLPDGYLANQKAVQYMVDMTRDIADSHFQLTFNNYYPYTLGVFSFRNRSFQPSGVRHYMRGDRDKIKGSVFSDTIPNNYLTKENKIGSINNGGFLFITGIIPFENKNILYVHFSQFALNTLYYTKILSTAPIKPAMEQFFRWLKDPSIDGLIIDLRNNPGGSISDMNFFIGRMITKPHHVMYTRTKSGSGRQDYTPWVKNYVKPYPGAVDLTSKPVGVLIDMYSISMSEATALSVKRIFPKSYIVGEKSWGGTGPVAQERVKYLGGQYTAAGFVSVYMSAMEVRDVNLKSYENKGIEPEYFVAWDTTAIKSGRDVQLEKVISLVGSN